MREENMPVGGMRRFMIKVSSSKGSKWFFRILGGFILLFFLIINLFPLIWVLMSSFKTNREILNFALSLPENFSFSNYLRVAREPGIFLAFLNSGIVTAISIVINVAICYIAAYCISRFNFKFLKIMSVLLAFGLLVPINSALLPIKFVSDALHLSNSVPGLGVLYAALQIPLSILILQGHISQIPRALDEAASIDGAGHFRTAVRVIAPVAKPGIITVLILQAVFSWNEFQFALTLISDQSKKTIQILTRNFLGLYQANYGALFAAVILAIIPMVVVFLFFQNRVIEAFTSGSLKE